MRDGPFIPAWLDDAGLSQAEFRLYCHLCRRADNKTGIAWPRADSIARDCRMARNTVWTTISSLEVKGLIRRVGKSFAGSNRYQILVSSIGANKAPIDTAPIGANQILQSAQMDSHQSAQSDSREGSPNKVPQGRCFSQSGYRGQVKSHDNKAKQSAPVNTGRRAATIEEA
jgi:hypothetical protein